MTLEQILFIALFVLIPLLNFLAGAARRRMQRQAEPRVPPPSTEVAVLPPMADAAPPWAAPPRPPAPAASPDPPDARRRRERVGLAEARRGMVLMAILGTCPGLEPPPRGEAGGTTDPARRSSPRSGAPPRG